MPHSGSDLDRFLRRVHRRYVVLRAAEGMGLGALVGCAVGLVLLALLWWEGRAALGPSAAAIAFGACVGLAWGIARRPRLLDAATEADRQLGLADLLGTALTAGHRLVNDQPDPWAESVLAVAEARCRTLGPSAVVLNRLGARAWGGIGLATALLLTLALLAGSPADTRAARANPSDRTAGNDLAAEPSAQPEHPLLTAAVPQRNAPPESDNDDRTHPTPGASAADPTSPDATGAAAPRGDPNSAGSPSAGAASGATGSGRTKPPAAPQPNPSTPAASATDHHDPRQPSAGSTAGGAGRSTIGPTSPTPGLTGAGSAGAAAAHETAPWQSDNWSRDVQNARDAVDSGRVPAGYRDVVRKYFERQ